MAKLSGTPQIFLAFKTDNWHSKESYELVYIGENIEDILAQLQAYSGMTPNQADQIRQNKQSQCNNLDFEWMIEEQRLNCFC